MVRIFICLILFLLSFLSIWETSLAINPDLSERKNNSLSEALVGNIINGMPTNGIARPFYVKVKNRDNRFEFCGGSVIGRIWVLTSARCVEGLTPNMIVVEASDYWVDAQASTFYSVSRLFVAPGFESFPKPANDLALLKVSQNIDWKRIIHMCDSERKLGTGLGSCGMGAVSNSEFKFAKILMEARFYQTTIQNIGLFDMKSCPPYLICTDPLAADTGSLSLMDEGSPLFVYTCGTLVPECLYGVASYYGETENYFTNVPVFYTWISSTILENIV